MVALLWVPLLGVALLGARLPVLAWLATGIVTAGVIVAWVRPGEFSRLLSEGRMILAGMLSGGLFGISSIAFRGGIKALTQGGFVTRSLSVLVLTLAIQSMLLGAWLALRDRPAFIGSLRERRESHGRGLS